MIVLFTPEATEAQRTAVEQALRRHGAEPQRLHGGVSHALSAACDPPPSLLAMPGVASVMLDEVAFPRAHHRSATARTVVRVGRAVIGEGPPCLIAGPCAVESEAQLDEVAALCAKLSIPLMRAGAFKPRTSPYSFRGAGIDGLKLLRAVADRYGLGVVSEVMEPARVDEMAALCDMLQVGSRNMQNFALLAALGRAGRPVLLKRGMSATLDEWLLAAEYILDAGNPQVILCERGVRHFDPAVRNLLDLSAVPLLRARTHLPVLVDPSHGTGVREAVSPMALAAIAAGADGVMLEVHPDPGVARSDGFQALTPAMLEALVPRLRAVAACLSA